MRWGLGEGGEHKEGGVGSCRQKPLRDRQVMTRREMRPGSLLRALGGDLVVQR